MAMVRRPSLDDYDRGDKQYFAERISGRAQGLYGEDMQPDLAHRPAVKIALSKEQSAAQNAEAQRRKQEYDARRKESMELYRRLEAKRRKEAAYLREREYALAQERAKLRQQWLEDQRKAEEAARRRREQFQEQEAEWRRIEAEKAQSEAARRAKALEEGVRKYDEAFSAVRAATLKRIEQEKARENAEYKARVKALIDSAVSEPRWGEGTFILLTDDVPVRWNDHPETGHIHMKAASVWNVGARLAAAIVSRGYAMVLNAS